VRGSAGERVLLLGQDRMARSRSAVGAGQASGRGSGGIPIGAVGRLAAPRTVPSPSPRLSSGRPTPVKLPGDASAGALGGGKLRESGGSAPPSVS